MVQLTMKKMWNNKIDNVDKEEMDKIHEDKPRENNAEDTEQTNPTHGELVEEEEQPEWITGTKDTVNLIDLIRIV